MVQWLRLQFSMHRVRLQSLLGKLRSPVTQWSKHQNINGSNTVTNSINNLKKKKGPHQKKSLSWNRLVLSVSAGATVLRPAKRTGKGGQDLDS